MVANDNVVFVLNQFEEKLKLLIRVFLVVVTLEDKFPVTIEESFSVKAIRS